MPRDYQNRGYICDEIKTYFGIVKKGVDNFIESLNLGIKNRNLSKVRFTTTQIKSSIENANSYFEYLKK